MAAERELGLKLVVDDSDLERAINRRSDEMQERFNSASSRLGGGSGSGAGGAAAAEATQAQNTARAAERMAEASERAANAQERRASSARSEGNSVEALQAKYQRMLAIIQRLESNGMSEELARAQSEAAGLADRMRRVTQEEERQVEMLQQATRLRASSTEIRRGINDERTRREETTPRNALIAGIEQGAGFESEFIEFMAGSGGMKGRLAAGAGMAGGMLGIAAVEALMSQFSELAGRSKELAKNFSDNGGPLDRLNDSTKRLKEAQDRIAASPAMTKFVDALTQAQLKLTEFAGTIIDQIGKNFKMPEFKMPWDSGKPNANEEKNLGDNLKKERAEEAKRQVSMRGELQDSFKELVNDRMKAERDIATEREKMEVDLARKRRDLAQEIKDFELESARKREDIEIAIADANETRANRLADLEAKRTQQEMQLDFSAQQKQQTYENERAAGRERLELDIAQTRRKRELDKQSSRENFDAEQGYARENALMELSETNDPRARRQMSRRLRTQLEQNKDRFEREQRQGDRAANADEQSKRENLEQNEKEAARKRELEIAQIEFQRKIQMMQVEQERLVIEREHVKTIEKLNKAMERLNEDVEIQREKFKTRQGDLEQDETMTRRDFETSTADTMRGLDRNEIGFAKQLRQAGLTPEMLASLKQSNPALREMLAKEAKARGSSIEEEERKERATIGQNKLGQLDSYVKDKIVGNVGLPPGMPDPFGVISGFMKGIVKTILPNPTDFIKEQTTNRAKEQRAQNGGSGAGGTDGGSTMSFAAPNINVSGGGGGGTDGGLSPQAQREIKDIWSATIDRFAQQVQTISANSRQSGSGAGSGNVTSADMLRKTLEQEMLARQNRG